MRGLDKNNDSRALDTLVELGRRQGAAISSADLDAGLATVTARLNATRNRHRRIKRLAPVLSLALAVLALLVSRPWFEREAVTLTYSTQGGVVLDGGYLREINGDGVVLTFEEGTRFALAPGARARLRSVNSVGARLGLEGGAASFEVTPNIAHRWEVEAGPFVVQVKGTTFDVAWDPGTEQFELDLKQGEVVVLGPVSGGELALRAGQRLVVDLRRGETRITDGRGAEGDAVRDNTVSKSEPPTQALDDQSKPALGPPNVESHEPTSPSSKRDWVNALARGKWDEIIEQAERIGTATIYATASLEDLFALANSARYRHRTQLARDSLMTLRRRFNHSARSVDALFLLGRVDETRSDFGAARIWYEQYLDRAPTGAFAAEALGRKMMLIARSSGAASARPIAVQYVRQFPNGSYAGSARALLEAR